MPEGLSKKLLESAARIPDSSTCQLRSLPTAGWSAGRQQTQPCSDGRLKERHALCPPCLRRTPDAQAHFQHRREQAAEEDDDADHGDVELQVLRDGRVRQRRQKGQRARVFLLAQLLLLCPLPALQGFAEWQTIHDPWPSQKDAPPTPSFAPLRPAAAEGILGRQHGACMGGASR